MTTKRTNTKSTAPVTSGKPAGNSTWRGFVNLELRPQDKDKALQMITDPLALWAAIEGVLMSNYRLSIGYSQKENLYTATATGTSEHDTDEGIAVSARASAPDRAIAAVMCKVEVAQFALAQLFEGTTFRPVDL